MFCRILLQETKGQKKMQKIGIIVDATLLFGRRLHQINDPDCLASLGAGSVQSLKPLRVRCNHVRFPTLESCQFDELAVSNTNDHVVFAEEQETRLASWQISNIYI
jgi:hypothetical protein